jgi:hypothetical protein
MQYLPGIYGHGRLKINCFCRVFTGMGRPKLPPARRKKKVTITPAPEVLAFVDAHVGLGKPYKDRTHAFEQAVYLLMQKAEK